MNGRDASAIQEDKEESIADGGARDNKGTC